MIRRTKPEETPISVTGLSDEKTREVDLLLHCARTHLDTQHVQHVRTLLQESLDWAYVIRMALWHGVMPLLYRSLNDTCPDAVPKAALEELRSYFLANAGRSLFLTRELLKLLDTFKTREIPAIAYKGPLLAASVYGNLALRQFGDLDILVHENDFGRSEDLLISEGYQLKTPYGWESSFLDVSGRVCVDLHKALTPSVFPISFDFEGLWRRLESISIGGITRSHLSPEDMLIILCVQISKDSWADQYQLNKICDIAELLRVHQSMDWGRVMENARRMRSQRILLFGLRLANQLLGTVLSEDVLRSMQAEPLVSELATQVRKRLFDETSHRSPNQFIDKARSHAKYREHVRDKVFPYYAWYIPRVIIPNEMDRALLPLPKFLSFLYYLLRPIRLLGTYILKPWELFKRMD